MNKKNRKKAIQLTMLFLLLTILMTPLTILTILNSPSSSTEQTKSDLNSNDNPPQELNTFIIDDLGGGNYTWSEASNEPWCTGHGTEEDPYVIQSIQIDGNYTQTCLVIQNSNVHFILRNNNFTKGHGVFHKSGGINLYNVSNGHILNNHITNCLYGISLNECSQIEIYNNSIYAGSVGIELLYSEYISIGQCYIYNPIKGISCGACQYLHVFQNLIEHCGNTALILGGNNSKVENNILRYSWSMGLLLGGWNNEVINNKIDYNGWGPHPGSKNGIVIYQFSNSNIISRNIISNHQFEGLSCYYDAYDNLIYDNFFINNGKNANDAGGHNIWNNSVIGNYWDDYSGSDSNSDGIGDTPYDVQTSPLTQDELPIHGNPFHDGSAVLIDGTQSTGSTSWQWISTRYWCEGSGTWNDPYIIKDLIIDGQGVDNCIEIRDSSVPFIIMNCTLYNASPLDYQAAIYLDNVDNALILENDCSYNGHIGIIFYENCNNNTIQGNVIYNNQGAAISIRESSENNYIYNNWIANCKGDHAIYLLHSDHNVIYKNFVLGSLTGIRVHATEHTSVLGNTCDRNQVGISLRGGHYSRIAHNDIISSSNHGILLDITTQCDIYDNYIYNTTYDGIRIIDNSRYNEIYSNEIRESNRFGVNLDDANVHNNTFYENHFIDNDVNAFDDGTDNYWDNGSIGNYWSDYGSVDADDDGIGDDPHPIPGAGGSQDNFPIWEDGTEPIIIDELTGNDWEWAASKSWCIGSGIESDPYIIEDITIDGRDSGSCIEIRNSDKYFIIRNTILYNASGWIAPSYHSAIRLQNVRNGRLELNNCSINRGYGVYLINSNFTHISGNTLKNNSDDAIVLDSSHFNNITANLITNNSDVGITNFESNHNSITNNRILINVDSGMDILTSEGIKISNNIVENNEQGIWFSGSINSTVSNNEIFKCLNGILLQQSKNVSVLENEVHNSTQTGIYLYQSPNNTISSNFASHNDQYGIYLYESDDNNLFSNHIWGSRYEALNIVLSNDVILSNNNVSNNLEHGIYIQMSNNSLVESNLVMDNGHNGIHMRDVAYSILLNNIAENNEWRGIYSLTIRNVTIMGNNISNNHGMGFYINNCNSSKIINNLISNNHNTGFYINTGYNNNLSNNILHSNLNTGLFSYNSKESNIHQNQVYNNSQDGIAVEFSDTMIVSSNQVYNNSRNGCTTNTIYYSTFINNDIHENQESGILIWSNTENNTFIGNNVSKNSQYGIYIYYSNDNNFTHNEIFENDLDGVYLRNSHENIFKSNKLRDNWASGIYLSYSNQTEIIENYYYDNGIGVEIWYGDYNVIHHNNFTLNQNTAVDSGLHNLWDDGTTGNYWDDYGGIDADDDGIGDTPYTISGSAGSQDNYPIWDDGPETILDPGAFTLSSTAEDPDDDGIFDLTWTTSAGADNYSLYTYS
ncbi:MAG: right-handed parallel beta-helix repeat-containing protein, partial [Promethearchaeota archaeon]